MFAGFWSSILGVLAILYPYIMGGGAAVGALWFGKWLLAHPESKYNLYYPYIIQAVLMAEKANTGSNKVNIFFDEFTKLYQAETGKDVDGALKAWAMRTKELVVLELKKTKTP